MDLQLQGRRALVTGSSSGIGEAIVRMLTEEGAKVVVHGRNRERAERVAEEIGAAGVAIGELSGEGAAESVHAEACEAVGGAADDALPPSCAPNGVTEAIRGALPAVQGVDRLLRRG